MAEFLGIDIGGTAVKLGIIDEKGTVSRKASHNVNFDDYETPILTTVLKKAEEFLGNDEIVGIGVSATGQIDSVSGVVAGSAGHIKNYLGSEIKKELRLKFNKPVYVGNDGNCMIIGEKWLGDINYKNIVGVVIGTGIGGGIIVNDEILLGDRGIASEIGQMITNGVRFETVASTKALITRMTKKLSADGRLSGKWIFENLNNKEINEEYNLWLEDLSDGLVSLIHIFNPECIVIGGGISEQRELFIDPLAKLIKKKAMPLFIERLDIRTAKLGNNAGMIGAVNKLMEELR